MQGIRVKRRQIPIGSISFKTQLVFLLIIGTLAFAWSQPAESAAADRPPNILLILADDLGYGDLSCYNPQSQVATPNLDRLATQGMRFTDAHSPATVCTPTRYSLLTGQLAFRTGYGGVFTGVGGPCLIEPERLTLGDMLQQKGYTTAMTGKWHIGMTFLTKEGRPSYEADVPKRRAGSWRDGGPALERVKQTDFTRPISDGPVHRGFDRFFGTACCPTTDWLYAFVEQDRVPVPPTELLDRDPLPKHPYAFDNRRGLIASNYDLEEVDLEFLKRSQKFVRQHVAERKNKPFFLFHSMQAVHLPSFAADRFKGKTDAGPHGDFIHEMDWIVGQLCRTLDDLNLANETIVLFASDNGPEVTTVIHMREDHDHDGARPWRGMKRDQWEGGHRTPFIVRWPGHVKSGTVSSQLLSLTDVFATVAAIIDFDLPNDAAEDSFNMLPVLLGQPVDRPVRDYLLQQTTSGRHLSIRDGQWKYLNHAGSGGNNYRSPRLAEYRLPEAAPEAPGQLYNLTDDPGETRNLYHEHPEIVERLSDQLEEFRKSGRSAPAR